MGIYLNPGNSTTLFRTKESKDQKTSIVEIQKFRFSNNADCHGIQNIIHLYLILSNCGVMDIIMRRKHF